MKNWWEARVARERLILLLASAALLSMLYFLMIWEPLIKGSENMAIRKNSAVELQSWLQAIEPELSQYKQVSGGQKTGTNDSVLSVADSSAKASGLGDAVKRMKPEGENMVRAWLENASFNPLLSWLHKLEEQNAIHVTDMNISRDTQAGHVKVRLTLQR